MKTRFFFDIEAQALDGEGFAYGYVVMNMNVATNEIVILEQGECYSILGAKEATPWVIDHVLPSLTHLTPYLQLTTDQIANLDASVLPKEIVLTNKALREKFWQVYCNWKGKAEFWADAGFPVESNFLIDVSKDGLIVDKDGVVKNDRTISMPYPFLDVANFVNVTVNRSQYSGLPGLRAHNPLDDAMASAYSLYEHQLQQYVIEREKEEELKAIKKFTQSTSQSLTIGSMFQHVGELLAKANTKENEIVEHSENKYSKHFNKT